MIDWPAISKMLTREQYEFATCVKPRIELVAGPGTGKTFAIAARVAWMITQRGVYPGEILLAVFSLAAKDALERRFAAWGFEEMPRIKTLHGYAVGHMHALWESRGVAGLAIADPWMAEDVLRSILSGPTARRDLVRIGIRRALTLLALWDAGAIVLESRTEALLLRAYLSRLREHGVVPVGAVIRSVVQEHDTLAAAGAYQGLRFIIVDEAHDITALERAYVDRIAETASAGITLVHDPRQRIFEWRGSRPADARMPDAARMSLAITHRFGPEIARLANRIADKAGPHAKSAPLRSLLPASDVSLRPYSGFVRHLDPVPWSAVGFALETKRYPDMAVLVRSNVEVDAIRSMWTDVNVMTVHQAKGHEWDEVIVLTSPTWPGPKNDDENWRILFVAVTRTRRRLVVVHPERSPIPRLLEE